MTITTTPVANRQEEAEVLVSLFVDIFGNQLILGDIHAPMREASDIFALRLDDEIVGGWSIFHGFGTPLVVFPTNIPDAWESIKNMVAMLNYPEILLSYPLQAENDHGKRPWEDWTLYQFEHLNTDNAMRITNDDIKVMDISHLPNIREATEKDLEALEEFYQKARDTGEYNGVFHPLQLKSENYVVCETEENEIIASAGTHFETPYTMQLGNIFVLPEHRGKGIGRAITTAVTLGAIKTKRVPTLFVNENNQPAIKLYESIGFEKFDAFAFYLGKKK